MSTQPKLADEAARLQARTEFHRPLVLEAGAGTGKTATLVARVLTWCLNAGWLRASEALRKPHQETPPERVAARVLQRLVAITFTEKAAGEMARRVAEGLTRLMRGEDLRGVRAEEVLEDADLREMRARALHQLVHQLHVETIHAFCRRLLQRHALDAGLHPFFQVDAKGHAQRGLITDVLQDRLPQAWGLPGEEDFLQLAAQGMGAPEMQTNLETLLAEGVDPDVFARDPFCKQDVDALKARLRKPLEPLLDLLAQAFPERPGKKPSKAEELTRSLENVLKAAQKDDLQHLIQACQEFSESGLLKTMRDKLREGFGVREQKALGSQESEAARLMGDVRPMLVNAAQLNPELVQPARKVARSLLREVRQRMRACGQVTFGDLLLETERLLTSQPQIARAEARDMDQLLVDEFQDTDPRQYSIVRMLALEPDPEDRPGLFLVGDPKQSIYGWRHADLGAYADFLRRVGQAGGQVLALCVNFRSVPAILDEVERAITPIMIPDPGLQPNFQKLLPGPRREGQAGFCQAGRRPVEYWVSWPRTDEQGRPQPGRKPSADLARQIEARALARDLLELHEQQVKWSDVAVLMRAMGEQDIYLNALREAGIPLVVERDRSFYKRREIMDAACLLRAVLDPNDMLALVGFLRSPLVGVPDAAWLPLWKHGLPALASSLRQLQPARNGQPSSARRVDLCVQAAASDLPADTPGQEQVPHWPVTLRFALRALAHLRWSLEHESSGLFVERLRGILLQEETEAARYLGAHRLANLQAFLGDLLGTLSDPAGGISAVLRELRRGVRQDVARDTGEVGAEEDAVRIMSIHKAKGLDFPHVYVVDLHHGGGGGHSNPCQVAQLDGETHYRIFGSPTPGFDMLVAHDEAVSRAEAVRALYVAMTRPSERLVLVGCFKPQPPASANDARHACDLLSLRSGGLPDLEQLTLGDAQAAVRHEDQDSVLWVLPDHAGARAAELAPVEARGEPLTCAQAQADASCLARAREAAAERQARTLTGAASQRVAQEQARQPPKRERSRPSPEPLPKGEDGRLLARALGVAIHAALEELDLALDLPAAAGIQGTVWLRHLAPLLPPRLLDEASQEAAQLWQHMASGPLLARLLGLGAGVLGRELPFLLAPAPEAPDGPLSAWAGSIDLLYRDPDSARLVVADYKTDLATREDAQALLDHYAPQGRTYVDAIHAAFPGEAPPRFELWLLRAGCVCPADESDITSRDG